jgi:hypothetical protein
MINDQGGINGRKINFISYDDSYNPPKTVEQVRRLAESDEVLSLSETQSGWQVKSNRAMLLVDERCLQPDLVGADRIVPVASVAASKDLDASSSTQRAAT